MTESKVESRTNRELALASEDRSRRVERSHRLLTMIAAGFVFLALCLMFVDFRRLDHLAPRHEIHSGHPLRVVRPVKMAGKHVTASLAVAAR